MAEVPSDIDWTTVSMVIGMVASIIVALFMVGLGVSREYRDEARRNAANIAITRATDKHLKVHAKYRQ